MHPFDSAKVVRASNHVAGEIVDLHGVLGIERDRDEVRGRRGREASVELRDQVIEASAEGLGAAGRAGGEAVDWATAPFRSVDLDGDGVPDKPRVVSAAEDVAGEELGGDGVGSAATDT